jgi:hypothetical protein
MIVLASMPKEWVIFISTLGAYATSTEVIAQITAHNSMLACDHLSQGVTTLIPNEYRQSSKSSVLFVQVRGSKTTQNAYC